MDKHAEKTALSKMFLSPLSNGVNSQKKKIQGDLIEYFSEGVVYQKANRKPQ